jgi:succinate dehydrogenase/fumarate reductase flavoprotein subunit
LRHSEQQRNGWGVYPSESGENLPTLAAERRAQGLTGRGNALIGALMEACLVNGVELVANARVVGLDRSNGKITGVDVVREGVEERYETRRGVVLASGGFEWNKTLVRSLIGLPLEAPLSPPHNDGDALKMASRVGAQMAHTRMAWWVPSVTVDGETVDGVPSHRTLSGNKGLPGAICVNRGGRRFANEALNYNDFGQAMAAFDPHSYEFPNLPAWVIFDERHYQTYPLGLAEVPRDVARERLLRTAPTLRALAEEIGVDGNGLVAEVDEFNRHAHDGLDPVFRRGETAWERYRADPNFPNPTVRPFGEGPYYAYRQRLGCFGTKGGPAIDDKSRVLDLEGRPIEGLFAAGNASACVFGPAYPGGGGTIGPAIVFGYIAGAMATQPA